MAMPPRGETIEEIKRLDGLPEGLTPLVDLEWWSLVC